MTKPGNGLATPPPPHAWRPRLRVLTFVFAALLAAAIGAAHRDPVLWARFMELLPPRPTSRPDRGADIEQLDPPLGIAMPDTDATREIRRRLGNARHGCLVVATGDCGSCMSFDFAAWSAFLRARRIALVGVSTAPQARMQVFVQELHVPIVAVSDLGGAALGALNAAWAGRAFYFSPSLRLRWRTSVQHSVVAGDDLRSFRRYLDGNR